LDETDKKNEALLIPLTDQIHFQKELLEDAKQFYLSKCSIECVNIKQFQLEVEAVLIEEGKMMDALRMSTSVEEHLSKIRKEVSYPTYTKMFLRSTQ